MKSFERALVALVLVASLGACGQAPSGAGGGSPVPAATGSPDSHAGHAMPAASGSPEAHAGHAHAPGEHPSGPALEAAMGTNPDPPVAGEPAEVGFLVTRGGQPVREYEVVHEKKAHMIVISADLADFQHLHPELDQQGAWRAPVTFPHPNVYRVYLDVTPTGGPQQVLRSQLQVPGSAPDRAPLRPDYGPAKVDGVDVALKMEPSHLRVGDAMLTFAVTRGGQPLTDLQPYLGAMGHLVIVDQTGAEFLHAHPTDTKDAAQGVTFHTTFPKPGLYKLWAQFQVAGKVLTAPFVVHVQ